MPGLIGQHLPTGFVPNPPLGSSTLLFDNTGVLSIKRNDGSVEPVSVPQLISVRVIVTSAEVLDAYINPVPLITLPSGQFIDPISISYRKLNGTVIYDTNTTAIIKLSNTFTRFNLNSSASDPKKLINNIREDGDIIETNLSNELLFTVAYGNAENGDADYEFFITYQIIEP